MNKCMDYQDGKIFFNKTTSFKKLFWNDSMKKVIKKTIQLISLKNKYIIENLRFAKSFMKQNLKHCYFDYI